MAECRRKGVPQAEYCKNGFVDTSTRLLERIERNSVARQSARVKDRGKRSNPFVFELSGTQWKVSRGVCLSACLPACPPVHLSVINRLPWLCWLSVAMYFQPWPNELSICMR